MVTVPYIQSFSITCFFGTILGWFAFARAKKTQGQAGCQRLELFSEVTIGVVGSYRGTFINYPVSSEPLVCVVTRYVHSSVPEVQVLA
jgi:uncharacterized membrane protein YeaQ/YmgE (transglycosylase-associated protein family)